MTTPITDILVTVGTVTVGGTDSNGVFWGIDAGGMADWYDGVDPRLNQVPVPRSHGSYRANSYSAAKVFTFTGYANAPNKPAAQFARDQFQGLYGNGGTTVLTVVDGGQTRTMTVEIGARLRAAPHINGIGFNWQLPLSAADPRKYGTPVTGSTGLPSVSQTGVDWTGGGAGGADWTGGGAGGLDWGSNSSNGLVSVSNAGSADTWPKFTIQGPVTNPSITDSAGNLLAYTGPALGAQDTLVLTANPLGPRSVLLNLGDARAALTTAQWAPITRGTSQTYQFGGSSAGTPSLSVTVAPAYW